jgi:hypothetical protein
MFLETRRSSNCSCAAGRPHDADMMPMVGVHRDLYRYEQRFKLASVSAQHQRLDRKHQGLDAQQHRVHEADSVDSMQCEPLECSGLL